MEKPKGLQNFHKDPELETFDELIKLLEHEQELKLRAFLEEVENLKASFNQLQKENADFREEKGKMLVDFLNYQAKINELTEENRHPLHIFPFVLRKNLRVERNVLPYSLPFYPS